MHICTLACWECKMKSRGCGPCEMTAQKGDLQLAGRLLLLTPRPIYNLEPT